MDAPSPLVWIDLEMTGLFPETCHVLEIASVVTDSDLEVIAEGPDLVVHQPDEVLAEMNEWCKVQHGESGLVDQIKASTVSLTDAEDQTIAFLRKHVPDGVSPLCGNSIGLDWRFIKVHMPRLAKFVSGELVDVTAIKELARRWYPEDKPPDKADTHRARDDIMESVAELKFYREHVFRQETR